MARKNEDKTRKQLFKFADLIGARADLEQLFRKWDAVLPLLPEGPERKAMARTAILEVQRLLDIHAESHDGLTIGNEIIIPAAAKKEES